MLHLLGCCQNMEEEFLIVSRSDFGYLKLVGWPLSGNSLLAYSSREKITMILLWAILFMVLAIVLGALAFGGIAIAVSFFTKILFFMALICFLISLILMVIEKIKGRREKKV